MSKEKTGVRMSNEIEEAVSTAIPIIQLSLDKIRVDEAKNLRKFSPDAKGIQELAESIEKEGLLQPVIVRPIPANGAGPDGEEYELVAGFRRMQALRSLKAATTMARVLPRHEFNAEFPVEDKLVNLTENRMRAELSYIDAAHAIKELVDAGMKKQDAGKAFGKSPAWVTRTLKLLELRPNIQKLIHEGKIPTRAVVALPDLTEDEQDKLLVELERQDKAEGSASEKVRKAQASTKKKKSDTRGRKKKRGRKPGSKVAKGPSVEEKQYVQVVKGTDMMVQAFTSKQKKAGKRGLPEKDQKVLAVLKALQVYLSGKKPVRYFTGAVVKVL